MMLEGINNLRNASSENQEHLHNIQQTEINRTTEIHPAVVEIVQSGHR